MGKHRLSGGRSQHRQDARDASRPADDARRRGGVPGTRAGWRQWGLLALRVGLILAGLAVLTFFVLMQVTPLPEPPVYAASIVYGRNDEVVGRLYVEDRIPVEMDRLPQYLLDAVVAVEDYRFFQHAGVDPLGIVRAALRNVAARRIVQGASTISQQLARALYLTQRRTFSRKIQEAILALKLEKRYTKRGILELYLNQVYFGHGSYGVEVAARTYFGKSAEDVSLSEAALLAGVLRIPEYYTPFRNPETGRARRDFVLSRMAELGYLSQDEAAAAKEEPLVLAELQPRVQVAPYFIDYVLAELAQRHPDVAAGVYQAGYRIYTTLDLDMQRAANAAVETKLTRGEPDVNGITQPQAALAAIDPQTGFIVAMVGGRDYSQTQLNRAAQAHRQPGSAFKPFLYTALLDRGYTLINQQVCEPVSFPAGPGQPPYEPKDYGSQHYHYAPLTMREAVKISDNVVAVRWANVIGPSVVIDYARRMGIYSPLQPYLPLVLGSFEVYPLELAAAYCPLANGGFRVRPVAIRKVVAADGTVIEENAPRIEAAVSPQAAYLMTSMLKTVMGPGGTGGHLGWILNRPSAGKTGTTSDSKDAWFVGFVPQVVCAVYVGYDEPQELWGPGGRLAGPIWAEFMRLGLQGIPATDFIRPPGIVDVQICSETLLRANPTCPSFTELFIEGTVPEEECPIFHAPLEPPEEPPAEPPEEPGEPGAGPEEPGPVDTPVWQQWFDEVRKAWERDGEDWPEGP